MTGDAKIIGFAQRQSRHHPASPMTPSWTDDAALACGTAALSILAPVIQALARLACQRETASCRG